MKKSLRVLIALLVITVFPFNLNSLKVKAEAVSFTDLPQEHWSSRYVQELANQSVLSGYPDGTFGPQKEVTRAEVAAILFKLSNNQQSHPMAYDDIAKDDWFYPFVERVGVAMPPSLGGKSNTSFRPNDPATREEVAVAISRMKNKDTSLSSTDGLGKFSDSEEISPLAVKDVAIVLNESYMAGYGNNTFRPKQSITRAEIAAVIWRAFAQANAEQSVVVNKLESSESIRVNHPLAELLMLSLGKHKENLYNSIKGLAVDGKSDAYYREQESASPNTYMRYDAHSGARRLFNDYEQSIDEIIKEEDMTVVLSPMNLNPTQIYYNGNSDTLYIRGISIFKKYVYIVIYEVKPQFKLIYCEKKEKVSTNPGDFLITGDDGAIYFSNYIEGNILTIKPGNPNTAKSIADFDKETDTGAKGERRLAALIHDNILYWFDSKTRTLTSLNLATEQQTSKKVALSDLLDVAVYNNHFYATNGKSVFEINLDGLERLLFSLTDLKYEQGLYDPQTNQFNKNISGSDTILKEITEIEFDKVGNLYVMDGQDKTMRRIRLNP